MYIVRLNTFLEYEFRSLRGVLNTTLCVKFVSDLQQISGFPGTLLSSSNKTDRHGITELLLKMAFNITTHNTHSMHQNTWRQKIKLKHVHSTSKYLFRSQVVHSITNSEGNSAQSFFYIYGNVRPNCLQKILQNTLRTIFKYHHWTTWKDKKTSILDTWHW
jgi:hypothetical protein